MKHQTVGLQFDFQKSERAKPWKTALPIAGVPLLAAVLLLALKPARESLKCLCNLVFAASEAVNAYAYDYFEVSDAASPVLALGLLVTAAAGVLLLAYLRGSKIVPLLAALALAGGEYLVRTDSSGGCQCADFCAAGAVGPACGYPAGQTGISAGGHGRFSDGTALGSRCSHGGGRSL